MNNYLDVSPEVQAALAAGKPVVALESTIIFHGMPYPQNVETALNVERIVREHGAAPATTAIIGGKLKAGLTREVTAFFRQVLWSLMTRFVSMRPTFLCSGTALVLLNMLQRATDMCSPALWLLREQERTE